MPNTPMGVFYPDGGWTFPPGLSGSGGAFQTMAESIDEALSNNALTLIDSVVTSGQVNSVQFSNIPQNFADLLLIWGGAQTEGNSYQTMGVRVNGNSSANYYGGRIGLQMNGTTANSSINGSGGASSGYAGIVGSGNSGGFVHFPRYAKTTTNKDWYGWGKCRRSSGDLNSSANFQMSTFAMGHHTLTGAITSMTFLVGGSGVSWTNESTFALLGTPLF